MGESAIVFSSIAFDRDDFLIPGFTVVHPATRDSSSANSLENVFGTCFGPTCGPFPDGSRVFAGVSSGDCSCRTARERSEGPYSSLLGTTRQPHGEAVWSFGPVLVIDVTGRSQRGHRGKASDAVGGPVVDSSVRRPVIEPSGVGGPVGRQ